MVTSDFDEHTPEAWPIEPLEKALAYRDALIGFFTGTPMEPSVYGDIRNDLLQNPVFSAQAPSFLRRNRDTSSLWSFAKEVDPSWEPRRKWLREQFEPLLDALEKGALQPSGDKPAAYDATAWTGAETLGQKAHAVKTLVPVSMVAIETLIAHLEAPGHNGGPPLENHEEAITNLRSLHAALGGLLTAVDDGKLQAAFGEGALLEIARYAGRAGKALKNDPVPYALAAAVMATLAACGLPGIGGWLSGMALAMKRSLPD